MIRARCLGTLAAACLVACGAGAAQVEPTEVAAAPSEPRTEPRTEPEPARIEAADAGTAPVASAEIDAGFDPSALLGLEDAPRAPAAVPTPPSVHGTGGGGQGEGCIQLATTCRARGGFGDAPRWCRDRDESRASVPGRVEVVSVSGGAADALSPVFESGLRQVTSCHREAIAASPARSVGEVVVAMRVEGSCLQHARLVSSTVRDPRLAACIVGVLDGAYAGASASAGPVRLRLRLSLE